MDLDEIFMVPGRSEHLKASRHWDLRYLSLAEHISTWSKDPSTRVGAVITKDNRVVSCGFNGLPRGIEDTEERLNNRELKYKMIVHGEINAMLFANESLDGATLYTMPFMPCSVCAGQVIQAGITRVVSVVNTNERWQESFRLTESEFKETGVALILYEPNLIPELIFQDRINEAS